MKLLSLDGEQIWTVIANDLIADAYICFRLTQGAKNDQNVAVQGWKVYGAGIPIF